MIGAEQVQTLPWKKEIHGEEGRQVTAQLNIRTAVASPLLGLHCALNETLAYFRMLPSSE